MGIKPPDSGRGDGSQGDQPSFSRCLECTGQPRRMWPRRCSLAARASSMSRRIPCAQTATVTYDPSRTSVAELAGWVRDCGYHCAGQSVPDHICDPLAEPAAAADEHDHPQTTSQAHTEHGPEHDHGDTDHGPEHDHGDTDHGPEHDHGDTDHGPEHDHGDTDHGAGHDHVITDVPASTDQRSGTPC